MLDAEVENRAADLLSRLGGALDRLVEEDEGRLPSPAWNSLATRTPELPDSSAIAYFGQGGPWDNPSWTM